MLQSIILPDQLYGELFTAVQMSRVFEDSKTFVDSVPKRDPHQIVQDYHDQKDQPGFDLKKFVEEKFFIPRTPVDDYKTQEHDVVDHINRLWTVLRRKSDNFFQGGSLLPLPFEYIVPGGRFREIYYWDTYFTMLGLKESRQYELMENMVKNLAYLINEYGHMPNGNRSYYLSRSQPPYFSLLLDLLSTIKGPNVYKDYLIELE
ncbi:MAG TPA: trehalase family glycosidase, partial [Flavisolibacter sp.]|nr:trehalase family glycosidase [Flavisolibacter sp.]